MYTSSRSDFSDPYDLTATRRAAVFLCYSRACRDAAVFRLPGKSGVVAVANTRSVMREPVPVQGPGPAVFEPLQFAAARDAADGVERRAEACAEIGGEPVGGRRVGREQELVILAPAGGCFDVCPLGEGDTADVDRGAYPRALHDVADIRGQPVREVHHGVYFGACTEPDAFGHLGQRVAVGCGGGGVVASGEDVMQSGARKSEFSGDEYRVAGACPAAALDVCVGDAADGRDIDRDACRRAGRVAPGERDAERFGEFPVLPSGTF